MDFSKPGEFTSPFPQTWQAINLHLPTNILAEVMPSNLLAALDFEWQITDSKGEVIIDEEFSGRQGWQDRMYVDAIPLFSFHPFDLGNYTFKCTVITGASALEGLEQRLICQYQEMLLASLAKVIGIVAIVNAGIILLIVLVITKIKRRKQATTKSTGSSAAPLRKLRDLMATPTVTKKIYRHTTK